MPTRTDFTVAQFRNAIDRQDSMTVILDVRTPEEFAEGHIPGASNISVTDSDFEKKVSKLDKKKTLLVYCRSGKRSVIASNKLLQLGFQHICNLENGFISWQAAGEKYVK